MMTDTLDGKPVLTSTKLCFLLAIAGRLDALSELSRPTRNSLGLFAKKANESKTIYYPFAILDGVNLSYNMFKYYFDAVVADNNIDLHNVMMTPGGIAAITAESLFIISFSLLACHFDGKETDKIKIDGEETDKVKKFFVKAWPYLRDIMKTLKNSYKGFRSTLKVAGMLGGQDLFNLLFPAGLIISILAAANRFWLRHIETRRKDQMDAIKFLLKEIKALEELGDDSKENYQNQIMRQSQSERLRNAAFVAKAINAVTDSLYYYIGMLTLAGLTSAALWPLMAVCLIYSISCIATRLYEEYFFQQKLIKKQVECELHLIGKRLNTAYKALLEASKDDYQKLLNEYADVSEEFNQKRQELYSFSKTSYKEAFLIGLSQGLYAHGTLSCALFIVSMVLLLFTTTVFPPALLITGVVSGLALMAAFVSRSLILNWRHRRDQKARLSEERPYKQLEDINQALQSTTDDNNIKLPSQEVFENALQDGLQVESALQTNIQDWLEVVRSFFSGLGKGQKTTDFVFNFLMEADDKGHYHDTPVMFGLMAAICVTFSITRAIRALAKGIGRSDLNTTAPPPATENDNDNDNDNDANDDLQPSPKPLSSQLTKTNNNLHRNRSFASVVGLFGKKDSNRIQYPEEKKSETTIMTLRTSSDMP